MVVFALVGRRVLTWAALWQVRPVGRGARRPRRGGKRPVSRSKFASEKVQLALSVADADPAGGGVVLSLAKPASFLVRRATKKNFHAESFLGFSASPNHLFPGARCRPAHCRPTEVRKVRLSAVKIRIFPRGVQKSRSKDFAISQGDSGGGGKAQETIPRESFFFLVCAPDY